MKAGVFQGPHKIGVATVSDPTLLSPTDAIVRITYSCICGSDLWYFRGISNRPPGGPVGHELLGVVEEVGSDVKNSKKGDIVVAPFDWRDGTCPACQHHMSSACWNGGVWGVKDTQGGQGEKVRVPFADASLFVIPKDTPEKLFPALLTLSDVMCTGHHAAVSAGVTKGSVVAVVGDGAVGLCGVLAAKRLGAKKIILMSRHPKRQEVGKLFGATDIVEEREDEGIAKVKELNNGVGVDCVLECVGTKSSWEAAFGSVRAGGRIGFVGVPQDNYLDMNRMFRENIGVIGGIAPAGDYIPELMPDVLSGKLDPSPVFDMTIPLDKLEEGYKAMDERRAIKVLIHPVE